MSEPIPGTQAPANNPQGTGPAPEQPPQQPPTQAAPQPANPPAAPTASEIETLRKEKEQFEKMARHYQSQHSQARQQLQALAGVPTQADPITEKAEVYSKKFGIALDDAKLFVTMIQEENAPIIQRNQMLEQQLQGTSMVQQAMQQAVEANPELFSDPKVANATYMAMQEAARRGQTTLITPDYARYLGAQEWALQFEPWKQKTTPPAPQPMPGYQPRQAWQPQGFNGPGTQYAPPPMTQQQNSITPEAAALAAQMASYTGVPLNPKP